MVNEMNFGQLKSTEPCSHQWGRQRQLRDAISLLLVVKGCRFGAVVYVVPSHAYGGYQVPPRNELSNPHPRL